MGIEAVLVNKDSLLEPWVVVVGGVQALWNRASLTRDASILGCTKPFHFGDLRVSTHFTPSLQTSVLNWEKAKSFWYLTPS